MELTRRQLLAGAGAGALAAGGIYRLAERTGRAPHRVPSTALPAEQHLLEGLRAVRDDGVEVVVPPLHHELITLRLKPAAGAELRDARSALAAALGSLDGDFPATPAGLGVTVGWGMPYFRGPVAAAADRYMPVDRRASRASSRTIPVLLDAIRFPSDPPGTILEQNDAVLLLRSDDPSALREGHARLVDALDLWTPTSIRRGFVGGGFDGGESLPRQMARAAGVPGADLIPERAELFLGFTSTQKASLGSGRIANIETLGYSDGGRDGYFRRGTTMHVSHIFEDLASWYLTFDHGQRAATVFGPNRDVGESTLTVAESPADVANLPGLLAGERRSHRIGHSPAIQLTSRLTHDVTGADGTVYRTGEAIPQRADFNTLDNPFFWSADPDRDQWTPDAAAGLHFVVFSPTSDDFKRNRLAMDGVLPDGQRLPLAPRDPGQGINSVLTTTHRQSFLVPPRVHRAFPLVEFL